MPIQTPQELFMHELEDMYDAEHRILKMLPQLAKECDNTQVKEAFQHHEQETKEQIENLEKAFKALGSKAKGTPCHGVMGLKEEHDSFLEQKPSPDVLQMFDLGAGQKTEQYEITSYTGLVEKATLLGHKDVAGLLQANLKQEQEMAKKVEKLDKQLGKEAVKEMAKA